MINVINVSFTVFFIVFAAILCIVVRNTEIPPNGHKNRGEMQK